MKLSFPTKLIFLVFTFIVTSVSGSAGVVFYLYQKDKLASILANEVESTQRIASNLGSLVLMANIISLPKVEESRQIIALFENPCGSNPSVEVSRYFRNQLLELEIRPKDWISSLDVYKACKKLIAKKVFGPPEKTSTRIIPNGPQLMIPYITILIHNSDVNRLAILSMDRLASSASNTIFLTNDTGEIIWTADGEDYLKSAMADTGVLNNDLKGITKKSVDSHDSQILWVGTEGLLSYAPVSNEWALVSLSHAPTVLRPIAYALRQSLSLTISILFFFLFLAKLVSKLIVRPLDELRESAEKLGKGDFANRLPVTGYDEFSTVKRAFNRMMDEIIKLIEETKAKAGLENELNLAKKVQHMLIPSPFVQTKTVLMNSMMINASQCGGDWWGYIEVPDANRRPRLIVMVGDATGHGAPSALITAAVRGAVSVLSKMVEQNPSIADDPGTINRYLNRSVLEASRTEISMTFFVAVLDTEKQLIRCSNAGHNSPYLIKKNAESTSPIISPIGSPGVPLGYQEECNYEQIDEYPWIPGTKLFLYTDGLIECMRGDQVLFDRKSLRKILVAHGNLKGKVLLKKIMSERALKIMDLPQEDDITAVLCEYVEGQA